MEEKTCKLCEETRLLAEFSRTSVTDKALVIKGAFQDLGDLLQVARVEGRKILKVDKVIVLPVVSQYAENCYVVVVRHDGGSIPTVKLEGKKNNR